MQVLYIRHMSYLKDYSLRVMPHGFIIKITLFVTKLMSSNDVLIYLIALYS